MYMSERKKIRGIGFVTRDLLRNLASEQAYWIQLYDRNRADLFEPLQRSQSEGLLTSEEARVVNNYLLQ